MHIDFANWFEIFAAIIALACWLVRSLRSAAILAAMLTTTVAIEFTSKYLSQLYLANKLAKYSYAKVELYSILYNAITFCGMLGVIYYLTNDKKNKRQYLTAILCVLVFIAVNILFGQGYKVYNNYSTAFTYTLLVAFSLYKLRTYDESQFSKRKNFTILFFLLITVFYYTVNLPFFVFFHQMFAADRSNGVKLYRIINDGTNYPLYIALSLVAILSAMKEKN